METCIDVFDRNIHTVALGFVRYKSNLTGRERIAIQKFIQWLRIGQKTGLVKFAYFQGSRGVDVASKNPALCSVSRVSVKRSLSHVLNCSYANNSVEKAFHKFSFKHSSNFFLCVG